MSSKPREWARRYWRIGKEAWIYAGFDRSDTEGGAFVYVPPDLSRRHDTRLVSGLLIITSDLNCLYRVAPSSHFYVFYARR